MGKSVIDLTGQKFGRLKVIKRNYPNDKWGKPMWQCKCDCGTKNIIMGNSLRRGYTKSCGCLNIRKRLNSGIASMRAIIRNYKNQAKERGLNFNLTEEQFKELTQKECHYCGATPNEKNDRKSYNGVYIYNGIDRIDNNKGYTVENSVTCCKHCNYAKNTFTEQEFKDWIGRIYNKMYKGDNE